MGLGYHARGMAEGDRVGHGADRAAVVTKTVSGSAARAVGHRSGEDAGRETADRSRHPLSEQDHQNSRPASGHPQRPRANPAKSFAGDG